MLDAQTGELRPGRYPATSDTGRPDVFGHPHSFSGGYDRGASIDSGPSRFFYCAKADTDERVEVGGVRHPTVKPLALIRWLVRLVTPPGGVVLDPFLGSGTTAEAALLEGFDWVGCELTADYVPLVEARLARFAAGRSPGLPQPKPPRVEVEGQASLFG